MASRTWIRLLGSLGLVATLALAATGAGARPVTGTVEGSGGGGSTCIGGDYFCSVAPTTGVVTLAACEGITTRDVACFDLMRLTHSDAAASGAQHAFRSAPTGDVGGFGLATSVTGEGLRLIASIVGEGSSTGSGGQTIDVLFAGSGIVLDVDDVFNSPLLLALQTAPDEVAYLLLNGATAFDTAGGLSLNFDGLSRGYYGLSLYQGTFTGPATDVPEPGSLALVALALVAAGAAARRR